jgi:hypothetical protein
MSANSSTKEQSPRSIQWRFVALVGKLDCPTGCWTIRLSANGGDGEKPSSALKGKGEAISLFPALSTAIGRGVFKWVRPGKMPA